MKNATVLIGYTTILWAVTFPVLSEENTQSSTTTSADTSHSQEYYDGLKDGMNLCSKTPRACGISLSSDDTNPDLEQQIKDQCKQFPASCGIKVGPNTDGSTEEGIEQCRQDPTTCEIELNPDKDEFIQAGIEQGVAKCQADPSSCEIAGNEDGSTEEGIEQCRQDPQACQIESKQDGITQCQTNPTTCGINVNNNTDGSTQEGIAQCQKNPNSCGIQVDPNLSQVIQETIAQCRHNPTFCGIDTTQCTSPSNPVNSQLVHGFFSLTEGSLYLPAIDVPNIFDGSVTSYEVQMKIIPGREPLSFTVIQVAPIEK
jgi:hypothetical protein